MILRNSIIVVAVFLFLSCGGDSGLKKPPVSLDCLYYNILIGKEIKIEMDYAKVYEGVLLFCEKPLIGVLIFEPTVNIEPLLIDQIVHITIL